MTGGGTPPPQGGRTPGARSWLRLVLLVHRWLVALLFPSTFRRDYGAAMLEAFRSLLEDRREASWPVRARWLVHEAGDLLRAGTRERLSAGWAVLAGAMPRARAVTRWLVADVPVVVRSLARRPASTVACLLMVGVAIAASTMVWSVCEAVLLRPLPYERPQQLVVGWHPRPGQGLASPSLSKPELSDYRERATAFAGVSMYAYGSSNLTAGGEPIPMWTTWVAADLFEVLGVRPMLGRGFRPEEHQPGNDKVVILNGRVWQRRFGGDPAVIGSTLELDGEPYRVVGVMAPDFQIPLDVKWPGRTGLLLPLLDAREGDRREDRLGYFVARLRRGADLASARAQVRVLGAELQRDYPDLYPREAGWAMRLVPLEDEVAGEVRPILWLLGAAVAAVLLLACGNVAHFLLGRGARRRQEMAVRRALGASPLRLLWLGLVEALMLASVAGALALATTWLALGALLRLVPGNVPRLDEVVVGGGSAAAALALTLASGLGFGWLPAWSAARPSAPSLAAAAASRTGGDRGRGALVVVEVGFAAALLLLAATLLQSLIELRRTELGFDVEHTASVIYALDRSHVADDARAPAVLQEITDSLAAVPGVEATALASNTPLYTSGPSVRVEPEGVGAEAPAVHLVQLTVGPSYFSTLAIPVLRGRAIEERDGGNAEPVVVVNRAAAAKLFGDPFAAPGRRLRLLGVGGAGGADPTPSPAAGPWLGVIGVVGDVLHEGLGSKTEAMIYLAYAQHGRNGTEPIRWGNTLVRARRDPERLAPQLEAKIRERYPDLPLFTRSLRSHLEASLARPRFAAEVMIAFAAVAAALAAIGTYAVVSHAVTAGRHELGVRLAMGAGRTELVGLVLRRWMTRVALGLLGGLACAAASWRGVRGLLPGATPASPASYCVVAVVLVGVAYLACWLPARRAGRVEPLEVLRSG